MGRPVFRLKIALYVVAASFPLLGLLPPTTPNPTGMLKHVTDILNPPQNSTVTLYIREWEDGKQSRADVYEASFFGQDALLLRKTEPVADRGRTILVLRNTLWIEIPTARRPLQLTTEQRWLSDAAFADLARANFTRDYRIDRVADEFSEKPLAHLSLHSIDREVPYAGVELWVDKEHGQPVRARFTTASQVFVRTCEYLSAQYVVGSWRPTRFVFGDPSRPAWKGEVIFKNWTAARVDARFFNPAALGKEESVVMTPPRLADAMVGVSFRRQAAAEMVRIPSGNFVMGRDSGFPDEQPAHQAEQPGFFIDRTEVTIEQYKRFLAAKGGRQPTSPISPSFPKDYFTNARYNLFPVVNVSWQDANDYCGSVKKRLPTEAEWEKAARGTDQRVYPWGNIWDEEKVNGRETPFSSLPNKLVHFTVQSGKFQANASPYGALDMIGNAAEWVQDWYAAYPGSHNMNDAFGRKYKVVRGGSWVNSSLALSAVARDFADPRYGYESVGFRCAKSE